MALVPPSPDYTDRDFDSLRARLFSLVASVFPQWTETSVANFGNILVEQFAFVGDVLTYYQDAQAREAFLSLATLRRSLIAHARRLNYSPGTADAATCDLQVELASVPVGDVVFEAGDTFQTLDPATPAVFQVLADTTILAGTDPPVATVQVEHSSPAQESFQSDGTPYQRFDLGVGPFLDGSLVVTADNGAYTVVPDLLDSEASDLHVQVQVDENDRAQIRFGNGVAGAVPVGVVQVSYKVGGGSAGNVDPGTIKKVNRQYLDSLSNPVQVTVNNPARATGGGPRESIESIRDGIPRSLRALTRSVAREDFETHALKVPGVGKALMLTRNEDPAIDENTGVLVVAPVGGGAPSQAVLDAVEEIVTVTYPHTLTFSVSVKGPDYLAVDVHAVVYPTFGIGTAAQNAALGSRIRSNLADFFAPELDDGTPNPQIDFGGRTDGLVALSDVFNVVRDTTEVRRVGDKASDFMLAGEHASAAVDYDEIPTLGTVTLINGVSGAVIP